MDTFVVFDPTDRYHASKPLALLPQIEPFFLRDVLAIKRERGDADCADFRKVCDDFAYRLNATISGARRNMARWIENRQSWVDDKHHARRIAFLADLDAVSKARTL